jgi:hypothetical protein
MKENRITRFGDQNLQPCHVCAGIRKAGPLKDGHATCTRCGAHWFTPADRAVEYRGCLLMSVAVLCAIVLFAALIARGCR